MALACLWVPLRAVAAQQATRVEPHEPLLDGGDWALVGGLVVAHLALFPFDDELREEAVAFRSDGTDDVADILRPLGSTIPLGIVSAATWLTGTVTEERRVADVGLHAFAALALSNFVTGSVKVVAGRSRPLAQLADGSWVRNDSHEWDFMGGWGDEGTHRSYPSGHSSNAFTIAAVLAEELGGAVPWIAYPLAAGVAWSRVNDEAHWPSDVVMGALVGIMSAKVIVRRGHGQDGWLERTFLLERGALPGSVELSARLPAP